MKRDLTTVVKETIMNRYLTTETYDGCIEAWAESDNTKKAMNSDELACWVWQFAESKEQAINQHHTKHALWDADSQAGRPTKDTY